MERLFVFAVGLDSVKTTEGCCGVYRAITQAHMFVCVVQEHLPGGWLEFTATVQRDEKFILMKQKSVNVLLAKTLPSSQAWMQLQLRECVQLLVCVRMFNQKQKPSRVFIDFLMTTTAIMRTDRDGGHDDGDHVDSLEPKTASLVRIQYVPKSMFEKPPASASKVMVLRWPF